MPKKAFKARQALAEMPGKPSAQGKKMPKPKTKAKELNKCQSTKLKTSVFSSPKSVVPQRLSPLERFTSTPPGQVL